MYERVTHKKQGFTLAEVLIALALLGVLAAFLIPNVLMSTADAQRKAVLKDTFAWLSGEIYQAHLSKGAYNDQTTVFTYLAKRANAIKTCTDYIAEGCHSYSNATPGGAFVMANGATFFDFDPLPNGFPNINACANDACGDWVVIDWDGKDKGLNQFGEDMIQVRVSYGGLPWNGTPPGTVQCHDIPANPKNFALCTEILK